jgi:hypothetical protein
MNYFSDALVISIVLVLLFGSIAWYLYTRIQQTEQKNSLLESIVLNLKMDAEMKSYSDLPADEDISVTSPAELNTVVISRTPTPISHREANTDKAVIEEVTEELTDQYSSIIADAVNDIAPSSDPVHSVEEIHVNSLDDMVSGDEYNEMTLKELHALAKSRGISGASTMKKVAVIEALRTFDRAQTVKSGSASSLMEHSEVLSFE